jgi:hypothetical protein
MAVQCGMVTYVMVTTFITVPIASDSLLCSRSSLLLGRRNARQ